MTDIMEKGKPATPKRKAIVVEEFSKDIPQTAARLVIIETKHGPYKSWAAFPLKTRPIRSRGKQTATEEKEEDELDAKVNEQMDEAWDRLAAVTTPVQTPAGGSYGTPGVMDGFIKAVPGRVLLPSKKDPKKKRWFRVGPKVNKPWLHPGFSDVALELGKKLTHEEAVVVWNKRKAMGKAETMEEAVHKQYLRELVESYLGSTGNLSMTPEEIESKLFGVDIPVKRLIEFAPTTPQHMADLKFKYNFKDVEVYSQFNQKLVADYLDKEFSKLAGKVEVDGEGLLTLRVVNIDPNENARAKYIRDESAMVLDKRFPHILAHEYAHFIYDKKMANISNIPGLVMLHAIAAAPTMEMRRGAIISGFDEYIERIKNENTKNPNPKTEAFIELMDRLEDFYAKNADVFPAMGWWTGEYIYPIVDSSDVLAFRLKELTNMLQPTEMFARAVQHYADRSVLAHFAPMEHLDTFENVINEWGDKYLKTGIVKSFVILEAKRDKGFFNYWELAKDKWYELIKEAMEKFNVHFDLENNDPEGPQRVITIPQNEWEFTKCRFKCEMWRAGGDWEYPVKYFKCQLEEGYASEISTYNKNAGMFVFIPNKTEGNDHLVFGEKTKRWNAPDANSYKKGIDPEPNDKKCWKTLNEYLKKLVFDEIAKVRGEAQERQEIQGEVQEHDFSKKSYVILEKARPPGLVLMPSKKNPRVEAISKAEVYVKPHASKTKTGKLTWVTAYHQHKKDAEQFGKNAPEVMAHELVGEFWPHIDPQFQETLQRAYDTDAQIWEGQTIGQHTKMVLDRFDRYFATAGAFTGRGYFSGLTEGTAIGLVDAKKIFRFFLALHDVGKAIAIHTTGDKHKQHEYTGAAVQQCMNEAVPKQYSGEVLKDLLAKIQLFSDLAGQDVIGDYLTKPKIGPVFTAQKIVDMAAKNNVAALDFLALAKVYFMCDAGSYTKDAGNYESLDYLFKFHEKGYEFEGMVRKVYDRANMEFSPAVKKRMEMLEHEVNKLDQHKGAIE